MTLNGSSKVSIRPATGSISHYPLQKNSVPHGVMMDLWFSRIIQSASSYQGAVHIVLALSGRAGGSERR